MRRSTVALWALVVVGILAILLLGHVHVYWGVNRGVVLDRVGVCEYWTDTHQFHCSTKIED